MTPVEASYTEEDWEQQKEEVLALQVRVTSLLIAYSSLTFTYLGWPGCCYLIYSRALVAPLTSGEL